MARTIGTGHQDLKLLNRRMVAGWLLAAAIAACVIVGICFLTNPSKEYQIRITIPAGCMEPFSYSDEEICPKSGTLTIYAGEGLGDTEILLLPVESPSDTEISLLPGDAANPFEPVYITPGMPVRFELERGAWYRIGVNVQNPEDEDMNVYVSVKNVDVRIADKADAAGTDLAGASAAQADGTGENGVGAGMAEAGGTGADGAGTGGTDSDGEGAGETGKDGLSEQNGTDSAETAGATDEEDKPQRHDLGDLDGNGEQEYLLLTVLTDDSEYDMHLSFYFNGEPSYEYDDLLRLYPTEAEYIDLDQDGEKEIFFAFYPMVNSMPLIEYAVLKQSGNGWKALEMIHGETMLDNAFPISCRYGSTDNTIVITCEGTEKEIIYDIETHYENVIKEYREYNMDYSAYARILEGNMYKEGDEFGGIAAWGIWEICSGTYDGRNCLIATHGLQGPEGKFDTIGLVDVYFDYNEKGLVNILDMEFRDQYEF